MRGEPSRPASFQAASVFSRPCASVWTAVDQKPKRGDREIARVRFLRRCPAAALCVDRYDDWSRLAWVQLLGQVEILGPGEAPAGLEALTRKYRPYRESPPPGSVLRLDVERALSWRAAD